MKKILLILLLVPLTLFGQRAYHFSNAGNDVTGDGTITTPFQTIAKANSLQSGLSTVGDSLLFKRGDTFNDAALDLRKSGTESNKFLIGAYGEGDDPIFTGLQTVSFSAYNDSVDFAVVAVESYPRYILINGDWQAMGRYPNSTYLTYESFVTNTKITITGLGDDPNWTGANAVIRKNDYTLDRTVITAHSGDELTYSNLGSSSNGTANYGAFIQNDYRTLDTFGEWFYDGDTLFIYSGTEDISTYTVEVPVRDNLIYAYYSDGADHVTIQDIHFRGSGLDAISLYRYSDYITIQNCEFNFSGENAINFVNQIRYATVTGNTINKSVKAGLYFVSSQNGAVTNNTIRNSGMLLGASNSATQNDGIYYNASDNFLVQYNIIDSSAYNGMFVNGNGYDVLNNYVTNSLLLLNDGGGIYTNNRTHTDRVISGNVIINVYGNNSGTPYATRRWARGVYLDTSASGVTVSNNTVQSAGDYGIFNGGGSNNTFLNNLSYDNNLGALFYQDYFAWNGGIRITGLTAKHNVNVAKKVGEWSMYVQVGTSYIEDMWTVSDSNYYMRPVAEGATIKINNDARTLTEWKTASSQDANSKVSPINLSDDSKITFIYNPENKDSTFNVIDKLTIDGDKFSGDTTLTAYSSAIFFVDPAPTPPDPAAVVIDSIYTATRKHMFVYSNAPSDGGDAITERGVVYSTVGAPTADSTKVTSGTGTGTFSTRISNMLKETTYYLRSYAINSVDTAYSDTYIVTTPEYNVMFSGEAPLVTKDGKLITYDPLVDPEPDTMVFCATYQTVYDSYETKPSDIVAWHDNMMVDSLVIHGFWARADIGYMFNADVEANARINFLNTATYSATPTNVNDSMWVAHYGYKGNGSNFYLTTGFNPLTHATKMKQDSATIYVYSLDTLQSATSTVVARKPTSPNDRLSLNHRNASNQIEWYVNSTAVASFTHTAPWSGGYAATRVDEANQRGFKNGVFIRTEADASTALPDAELLIFRIGLLYSLHHISALWLLNGFSNDDALLFHQIIERNVTAKLSLIE